MPCPGVAMAPQCLVPVWLWAGMPSSGVAVAPALQRLACLADLIRWCSETRRCPGHAVVSLPAQASRARPGRLPRGHRSQ